ncbi:MAG: ATP-binding protein [Cyclobacteriaceae bacterium]|nr:ATP-binding protein [Cyclobacteriaceae bacterium]UYN87421.1 MAG: ATP-binding protein [Cyclobacteriaceae bacterium]
MKPKKMMTMRHSEGIGVDREKLKALRELVAKGEGEHLEFKRKATHPEKIAREMIAFANSKGGTLLIGVADDGSIPGVKFPEEELYAVLKTLSKLTRPSISFKKEIISISPNRYVVSLQVPSGKRKPYFIRESRRKKHCYIRKADMSIKASWEVQKIIQLQIRKTDVQFTYGEHEQKLFRYLDKSNHITLMEFTALSGLNKYQASSLLIQLVLANLLKIEPHEKGDQYFIR